MKTVKPFRIGALTQAFEIDKKCYLTVAVLVCFELGDEAVLASDIDIWRCADVELGPLGVLDECQPKQRGEVLLNGFCFTAGGAPHPGASVRLAVGKAGKDSASTTWSIDKTLYVIGDRVFRIDGTPSDPKPFTKMPLTWERAFGGPTFPTNPVGVGAEPQKLDGVEVHRAPNVELPNALVKTRGDRPTPAGFGPYLRHWPQRWSKIGTYDMKWVKTEAPAYARDLDLSHFNAAPEDQQIDGYFRGDEVFLLQNMHPDKPSLTGRLPGLVGRAFITQKKEDGEPEFKEVPTHLDTIRFFPHLERGLLVFHGLARVAEDDADDVVNLIVGCDDLDAPRPVEHFRDVLAARLDRSTDRAILFREEDLVPKRVLRGGIGGAFPDMSGLVKSEGHVQRNIATRMEQENERTRASLVAAGVKPAEAKLPAPIAELDLDVDAERGFAQLAAMMAEEEGQKSRAEREVEAAEARLREQFKASGRDFDAEKQKALRDAAGPPKFSADGEMERLRDIRQLIDNIGQDTSELDATLEDPATYARFKKIEADLRENYRRTAHSAPFAAARLAEPERSAVRARIEAAHAEGLKFDAMDLTGADLSGLDLSGASLRGALLESADLKKTRLAGADLRGAVLAGADLTGAILTGANLAEANLGGARLVEADLSDVVDLTGAELARVEMTRAVVSRTQFDQVVFLETRLDGVDFRGARMKNATFYKAALPGARFGEANLFQCLFIETDLQGADFSRATIDRCSFVGARADGAKFLEASARNIRLVQSCSFKGCDFRGANLEKSTFRANDLTGSDFSLAKLDSVDFGKTVLVDANFYRAVARHGHFVRADLSGAKLVGANLESTMFMKAKVARADFTGSNLFRANFVRAKGDGATSFKDANVTRVLSGPKES